MAESYIRTSQEELTAMADELRKTNIFEEGQEFVFPSLDQTNIVKLIPKYGSTTVINRNGECESWVIIDNYNQEYHIGNNYMKPNLNTISYSDTANYYIYGLGTNLVESDLDNYLEVTGNGYYEVSINQNNQNNEIGTGTIILVYDSLGTFIEQFQIIIFGDVDGDGKITSNDVQIMEDERLSNNKSFTLIQSYAADVSEQYFVFDEQDTGIIDLIVMGEPGVYLDQIFGCFFSTQPTYTFYNNDNFWGFIEAYNYAIDKFYLKVLHGTLTQNDIEGIIFNENLFFGSKDQCNSYTNISKIKVTANFLTQENCCTRLTNLEEVEIINPDNVRLIGTKAFYGCANLKNLKCSPTTLEEGCFYGCTDLVFGNDELDLSRCFEFKDSCLAYSSLAEIHIGPLGSTIEQNAFRGCSNLVDVYLPDRPPNLMNINAFYDANDQLLSGLKFKVTSSAVLNLYAAATNWNYLTTIPSLFEVISS